MAHWALLGLLLYFVHVVCHIGHALQRFQAVLVLAVAFRYLPCLVPVWRLDFEALGVVFDCFCWCVFVDALIQNKKPSNVYACRSVSVLCTSHICFNERCWAYHIFVVHVVCHIGHALQSFRAVLVLAVGLRSFALSFCCVEARCWGFGGGVWLFLLMRVCRCPYTKQKAQQRTWV
jgi:hypothetical protein